MGGKFSTFSGYSRGVTKELVPGKKIVQAWSSSDLPQCHETEITFILNKKGNKTELLFTQTNLPADNYKALSDGWKQFYWQPLKEMLKG